MATQDYDLVVIGAGPGGYVAAIRGAQLGLKTLCIEKEKLGGICLNWGCIPTKALLRSAEVLDLARRAAEFGVKIEGTVSFDYPGIIARSRKVAADQEKGIQFLFKKHKVESLIGTATLKGAGKIAVKTAEGETTVSATHIVVATGARAKALPSVPIDGQRVIEYRGALALPQLPKRALVIGAGAIGVEFASFWSTLGVAVTIVEFLPRVVPLEDEEISQHLGRALSKHGVTIKTGTKVLSVKAQGAASLVELEKDGAKETVEVDLVLSAAGVQANVEGLGLEALGVKLERGFVAVDDVTSATNVKGVYAIGDVAGPPALAHVASAEAISCVERIAGHHPPPIDWDTIPACTFAHPEIGSVGLTEAAAKAAGKQLKVGRFPFRALGKARAAGDTDGFVKVIWDATDGRLLGAHIIGPGAPDLIAEYALARSTEVNAPSLMHTIHAHPTLAEALREATEDAYGVSVHL